MKFLFFPCKGPLTGSSGYGCDQRETIMKLLQHLFLCTVIQNDGQKGKDTWKEVAAMYPEMDFHFLAIDLSNRRRENSDNHSSFFQNQEMFIYLDELDELDRNTHAGIG